MGVGEACDFCGRMMVSETRTATVLFRPGGGKGRCAKAEEERQSGNSVMEVGGVGAATGMGRVLGGAGRTALALVSVRSAPRQLSPRSAR